MPFKRRIEAKVSDAHGRVIAETCTGATVITAYDRLGRRTPSGAQSRWEYDHRDLPQALHTSGHTISFTHVPAGREITRQIGPDLTLSSTWDSDSRLRTQTWNFSGRVRQCRSYDYRADGHVSVINDLLSGRRRFDLDPIGRVTAVHGNGFDERYAYDPAGQITRASWATPHRTWANAPTPVP
ncbi:hypothetical protein AB0K12_45795 [Nonomuraea sp. NPDC049419]|uniref:hypothetical protein n=1 Tax=Nonomuraea sp. NPDC049419 TaxID=3155772 RepID=UPI00344AC952